MTQDYELVVKGVRNFENKVTVTVALQDKERFDGEIFDLDVAMDRVEGEPPRVSWRVFYL
ncbi:DUF1327 domain-containing protein [Escherichia coli]|nr:DUF1327 domain-containing protein [Escherichia coli]